MGGAIGRILKFYRELFRGIEVSRAVNDPGGGALRTSEHFADPGDDSHPLPGDFVVTTPIPRSGAQAASGYADPVNAPVSQPGDKRIYGRRESDGVSIVQIWLKNDGSVVMSNAAGSLTLQADGEINANGATIAVDGTVTSPTAVIAPSIIVDGKELAGHNHSINSGSSAPGPTGPNN